MAAKSDGAAVAVEDDKPPRSLSEPSQAATNAAAATSPTAAAVCAVSRRGPPGGQAYTLLDCCWVLCALLVFFSDGATDLWLAADYYLRDDYWWFGLTLVFVVVPSAVVQVLSFWWFAYDYSELSGAHGSAAAAGEGTGDSAFGTKENDQHGAGAAAEVAGNAANATAIPASSSAATERGGRPRRRCAVCVWVFQTVLHALQLGQVWRTMPMMLRSIVSRKRIGLPLARMSALQCISPAMASGV